MLDNIILLPVMRDKSPNQVAGMLRLAADECREKPAEIVLDAEGHARRVSSKGMLNHQRLATITCRPGAIEGEYSWWLVPRSPQLLLDGSPALPLAALDGGMLLMHGGQRWWLSSVWTPRPRPAPASVAKRNCPVCGGELELAPVLQCPCGRYYHLEDPDRRNDPQLLNCYLSGPCGLCAHEPSLEPALLPDPGEALLGGWLHEQEVNVSGR